MLTTSALLATAFVRHRTFGGLIFCFLYDYPLVTMEIRYLTGFNEPESALILEKTPSTSSGHKSTLFVRPKDARHELWEGPRTGTGAAELFGVDEVLPISEFPTYLQSVFTSD